MLNIYKYRPFITLKVAASLDGKLSDGFGKSQSFIGQESQERIQAERSGHDAILTGIGTILQDDPLLTTQIDGASQTKLRVVLDTHLRFPLQSRIAATTFEGDLWIYTAPNPDADKKAALEKVGIKVIEIDLSSNGKISLPFVLEHLVNAGISRVIVEAGQGVTSSFLKLKIWDRLLLFRAPIIIGRQGIDAFGEIEEDANKAPRLKMVSMEAQGDDLLEIYEKAE